MNEVIKLRERIEELEALLRRLRDDPALLKRGRAGGQNQYAGMAPAYPMIDAVLKSKQTL